MKVCENVNCFKPARPERSYCSNACVPYGSSEVEKSTNAEQTDESTQAAHGDLSPRFSGRENMIMRGSKKDMHPTQSTENKSSPARSPQETETSKPIEKEQETTTEHFQQKSEYENQKERWNSMKGDAMKSEKPQESDMQKSEQKSLEKSTTEETNNLPAELSHAQLISSNEEKLVSLNLVDSSINRLHSQLKKLVPEEEEQDLWNGRFHLERAKMACLTAMSIAKLVSIKIDAIKTISEARRQ